MTSGSGLLEVGLPNAAEFATGTDDDGVILAPTWTIDQPETAEESAADSVWGPINGRKRYDDEEGDGDEDEVEFDVDDDESDADIGDDADDDFDDDDDDDDDDLDDDDDADDFDDD